MSNINKFTCMSYNFIYYRMVHMLVDFPVLKGIFFKKLFDRVGV